MKWSSLLLIVCTSSFFHLPLKASISVDKEVVSFGSDLDIGVSWSWTPNNTQLLSAKFLFYSRSSGSSTFVKFAESPISISSSTQGARYTKSLIWEPSSLGQWEVKVDVAYTLLSFTYVSNPWGGGYMSPVTNSYTSLVGTETVECRESVRKFPSIQNLKRATNVGGTFATLSASQFYQQVLNPHEEWANGLPFYLATSWESRPADPVEFNDVVQAHLDRNPLEVRVGSVGNILPFLDTRFMSHTMAEYDLGIDPSNPSPGDELFTASIDFIRSASFIDNLVERAAQSPNQQTVFWAEFDVSSNAVPNVYPIYLFNRIPYTDDYYIVSKDIIVKSDCSEYSNGTFSGFQFNHITNGAASFPQVDSSGSRITVAENKNNSTFVGPLFHQGSTQLVSSDKAYTYSKVIPSGGNFTFEITLAFGRGNLATGDTLGMLSGVAIRDTLNSNSRFEGAFFGKDFFKDTRPGGYSRISHLSRKNNGEFTRESKGVNLQNDLNLNDKIALIVQREDDLVYTAYVTKFDSNGVPDYSTAKALSVVDVSSFSGEDYLCLMYSRSFDPNDAFIVYSSFVNPKFIGCE